jgi:hypothetical protein
LAHDGVKWHRFAAARSDAGSRMWCIAWRTKNCENNPMHSSHLVAGISIFGSPENDLTRRANQGHTYIIPQFV